MEDNKTIIFLAEGNTLEIINVADAEDIITIENIENVGLTIK